MARYDLHFQIIDPTAQAFGATFTFGLDRAIKVTGFQKLMNRWLKLFCTPKGSQPIRPEEGTDFTSLIGSNVTDAAGLQAVISEHVEDANAQIRAIDRRSPWLTAEERLRDATITRFNVLDATRIEFWVELTNTAGARMTVLVPYAAGANG